MLWNNALIDLWMSSEYNSRARTQVIGLKTVIR